MKTLGHLLVVAVLLAAIFGVASREFSSVLASYESGNKVITITPKALIPNSSDWEGINPGSSTGSSTGSGSGSSSSNGNSPGSGSGVSTSSTSNTTANWAGYSASGATYTAVSGTWTVPSVSGVGVDSADAAWVGIGGVSTQDLIQAGTQDLVSASGQVQTTAFYELLPDTSQDVTNIDVNPGDSITVNITETSQGEWDIYIKDNTNGESSSVDVAYDSTLSSAEWIEEDPSDGQSQIPFDNFGSVQFASGQTTVNGVSESISEADGQALTMVSEDGTELATTSTLGSNGSSFSVSQSSTGDDNFSIDGESPGALFRRAAGFLSFRDNFKL